MNTMINISDLPEPVKKCYIKWSELTDIKDISIFFTDIFIHYEGDDFLLYYIKETIDGNKFVIKDKSLQELALYSYKYRLCFDKMLRYIKIINKLYEDIKH